PDRRHRPCPDLRTRRSVARRSRSSAGLGCPHRAGRKWRRSARHRRGGRCRHHSRTGVKTPRGSAVNLAHLLANAARSFPERAAVSIGDHRLYTYAAYGELAARVASSMTDRLGLQAGDRVALAMTNNAEYLAMLF